MKNRSYLLLLITACFAMQCKPSDSNTVTGGGKGGNVTIQVIPEYYGAYVDTCTVYIKYGTLDAPAGSSYDDSSVCTITGGVPTATFTNLKTGLYYFLAIGYHQEGGHPPDVKGSAQKTVQADGNVTVYIPTTWYIP
jgi:hypothetical protein